MGISRGVLGLETHQSRPCYQHAGKTVQFFGDTEMRNHARLSVLMCLLRCCWLVVNAVTCVHEDHATSAMMHGG